MITTIQQALRPFLIVYFITGLSFYPIKQSSSKIPWIKYLSILYSLIIWSTYVYVYNYMTTLFTCKILYPSPIHLTAVISISLTSIVSAIMNIFYQEDFQICMKRLAAINDTLEQLGTLQTYQKMHMYSKRLVIGWIISIFIENMYDIVWQLQRTQNMTWALLLSYILNYCWHLNAVIDLIFIFFLWYIGTRFDKVNEHMQYLSINEKHVPKYKWKKPIITLRYVICTDDYKQTLWTLMHLHLELYCIARQFNLIFGTQMTFAVVSHIANLTLFCFGFNILLMQYREYISLYHWLSLFFCILIILTRLYVINYICECVKVKAKKIDKIFHQLTNIIQYADVWKEINQFILQAIQHPLKFTGMGLFYFGNGFLRKLCTTIFMYVIIMIQMKVRLF